jgi:hypothetical protein
VCALAPLAHPPPALAHKRLDRYDAVIVDDIGYVQQDREEIRRYPKPGDVRGEMVQVLRNQADCTGFPVPHGLHGTPKPR